MTVHQVWPEDLNTAQIIIRLRNALCGIIQALQLWHDDINGGLFPLGFIESRADPNLYLGSKGILILLYVNDMSMSYPAANAKTNDSTSPDGPSLG